MPDCDLLIVNTQVFDGSGGEPAWADVAVSDGRICAVGTLSGVSARETVDGRGLALAPGFIDAHTHDDLFAIRCPGMLPKLSQGVTTVVVGNCGISATPVCGDNGLPEPMNLLGRPVEFQFRSYEEYSNALKSAGPATNLVALIGHTTLRANHMDRLDRRATPGEVAAMRKELESALAAGAFGLSTGLAYRSAVHADTEEVMGLAEPLAEAGALYATHMRTEGDAIREALEETFTIGRSAKAKVVISHLKCVGVDNWGRSQEVLDRLDTARASQEVGWDCYPYAASSTVLDLNQIDPRVEITITWSNAFPDCAGKSLTDIAANWKVPLLEAAERLLPAGAIYHSIDEGDMRRILSHPGTMIGSDGLPNDPHPHPRLWGTFPRVLGRYCRQEGLMSLPTAVHKMTGLPASRFGLQDRGLVREGYHADVVLFDPEKVIDAATFESPTQKSLGIEAVWVNGSLSYWEGEATGIRSGELLKRTPRG